MTSPNFIRFHNISQLQSIIIYILQFSPLLLLRDRYHSGLVEDDDEEGDEDDEEEEQKV